MLIRQHKQQTNRFVQMAGTCGCNYGFCLEVRVFPDKKTGVCTDWQRPGLRYFCTGHHKNRITVFDCPPLPPTFFSNTVSYPPRAPLETSSAVPFRAAAIAAHHTLQRHRPSSSTHVIRRCRQTNTIHFIMRPVFDREHRALIFWRHGAELLTFGLVPKPFYFSHHDKSNNDNGFYAS